MNNIPQNQTNLNHAKCLCFGAANVDIRCALIEPSVENTSNPATISKMVGGASLNTARIVALSGISSRFTGLVGTDENGQFVTMALKDADVENGLITDITLDTSTYISILEPDGSLKIACNDMGINDRFTTDHLNNRNIETAIRQSIAVFCDANIPTTTIKHILSLAEGKTRCATTVSPAKAPRLRPVLENIDILFTNVAEARALLGSADEHLDCADLAAQLAHSAVPRGVISDGANSLWLWQSGEVKRIKIPHLSGIIDVTGAGDALAGGTIAGFLDSKKFIDAVHQGIEAASKVLRVEGPCYN